MVPSMRRRLTPPFSVAFDSGLPGLDMRSSLAIQPQINVRTCDIPGSVVIGNDNENYSERNEWYLLRELRQK